jgi:hypothetical protein
MTPPPDGKADVLGGRYLTEGILGEGGMAVVHQALDIASGKRVALKQMRMPDKERKRAQMTELFEREYLTLAQLAHPRVVEVYDYGLSERGPYYTMELLDGGDLQQLAPLNWRDACALARDVCSTLSLLHSRRLVYRDLSPRNVRCTSEGLAKLIDFGGLSLMGPNPDAIGTPPCAAPEVLDCRPLDARTDLYALGATLYYTLTRRQAYPARSFDELWKLWGARPPPPSTFVGQLPEELDQLVMELLQLDPALRPVSAAEVMERLSALIGVPADEHLRVHQAYLSTPTLVGRAVQLARVRERTLLAAEQCGASLLIHGAPGVGRSRLLEACVLEAKLSGMFALRVDGASCDHAPYGALRALIAQLLETAREAAALKLESHRAALACLMYEADEATLAREGERVPLGLLGWLSEVAQERPVLIAVDDVARLDEASAACIALLARESAAHGLSVLVSASSDDLRGRERQPALSALVQASSLIELSPLDGMQTRELLSSVFGDVPNLHVLAAYVDQVAAGNPRDIMRLLWHLVDEQLVHYACGSWSLPERLPTDRLPSSMTEARKARLAKLSGAARRVAYAFSCEARHRFSFDECLQLSCVAEPGDLLLTLRELLDSGVIVRMGANYRLAQHGSGELFATIVKPQEMAETHERLARIFEAREDGIRTAQHLFRAGQDERGLSALVADAVRSEQRSDGSSQAFFELLKLLPKDLLGLYDHALSLCEKHGRSHRERDVLLSRLGGLVSHAVRDGSGFVYLNVRLAQLEHDAGLDLYAALPASLPPEERLRLALERAEQRYRATPAERRVLAPRAAIKPLATTLLAALGTISFSADYAAFCQLPSLAPLAPLAPAIQVAQQLAEGLGARISGRSEQAVAIYSALLARMDQPDRGGLQVLEHLVSRLRVALSLGALEASMGLRGALSRIELVQGEPDYETQTLMLRNLCQLWQGQSEEAARTKRRLEIRKALSSAHHGFEGQYLLSELCAYALADDLTHVKQASDSAAAHARTHSAWIPVQHYGRGEYHRIRGDGKRALNELQKALSLMHDGRHQLWPNAAGALLRTLVERRRYQEAIALGEGFLERARELELGYLINYLRMPLSLALCGARRFEEAAEQADAAIADLLALGSTGLNLALAYETRARVARAADDEASFAHFATLGAEQLPLANRRLLDAGYARRTRPPARERRTADGAALRAAFQKCGRSSMYRRPPAHARASQPPPCSQRARSPLPSLSPPTPASELQPPADAPVSSTTSTQAE